jgi:hypothetical protein
MTPRTQAVVDALADHFKSATKTKPVYVMSVIEGVRAELVSPDFVVNTIEGPVVGRPDAALCRGSGNELWIQTFDKLNRKYDETKIELYITSDPPQSWTKYDPKPDNSVLAAQYKSLQPLVIDAQWGTLNGHKNDYVVRSKEDPEDVWIVAKSLFESTYEFGS